MNKYLLLRDNKQTGPYSVEELSAKGLKPYDLVWLEGKSAAWRYPSEIEELKPFAPVVEEQPYDRFYKKQAQSSESNEQATSIAKNIEEKSSTPVIPVQPSAKPAQPAVSRKIYVTLPAATGKVNTNTAATPAKKESIPVQETKPVATPPAITKKTDPIPIEFEDTPSFSTLVEQHYQSNEKNVTEDAPIPVIPRKRKADTYKMLMRSIVAACLLLGGVVIGIAITYGTKDNTRQQELDRLVQQLQEKEQSKSNFPPSSNGSTSQPASGENQASITSTVSNNQTLEERPAGNSSNKKTVDLPASIPPSETNKSNDVKIVPAVVTQPEEIKPQTHQRETSPAAPRKDIYEQVAVEASNYKTGVLGGISDLYFTISNNSPFPLEMVEVEIKYLGPEKKVVKVQRLLFNDLAAGSQKTLEAPRTSRGVTIDYVITKINSKALGLARAGS